MAALILIIQARRNNTYVVKDNNMAKLETL